MNLLKIIQEQVLKKDAELITSNSKTNELKTKVKTLTDQILTLEQEKDNLARM
jgi:hypothetical protein